MKTVSKGKHVRPQDPEQETRLGPFQVASPPFPTPQRACDLLIFARGPRPNLLFWVMARCQRAVLVKPNQDSDLPGALGDEAE